MSSHSTTASFVIDTLIPTSTAVTEGTAKNDHRLLIVVVVLGILGLFLVAYIVYLTLRVKRREEDERGLGPFTGKVINTEHPAAQINPFGAGGPYSGRTAPRFQYNPGEDMRIAIRRPDGAWHFADSRTPFTPVGVDEIDVTPSPVSSRVSLLSSAYTYRHGYPNYSNYPKTPSSALPPAKAPTSAKKEVELDREPSLRGPPPPAYFREPCREYFDDSSRSPI